MGCSPSQSTPTSIADNLRKRNELLKQQIDVRMSLKQYEDALDLQRGMMKLQKRLSDKEQLVNCCLVLAEMLLEVHPADTNVIGEAMALLQEANQLDPTPSPEYLLTNANAHYLWGMQIADGPHSLEAGEHFNLSSNCLNTYLSLCSASPPEGLILSPKTIHRSHSMEIKYLSRKAFLETMAFGRLEQGIQLLQEAGEKQGHPQKIINNKISKMRNMHVQTCAALRIQTSFRRYSARRYSQERVKSQSFKDSLDNGERFCRACKIVQGGNFCAGCGYRLTVAATGYNKLAGVAELLVDNHS